MKKLRARRLPSHGHLIYVLVLCLGPSAAAQQVEDPMRPPESSYSGGGPGNAGDPGVGGEALVLTSTKISPKLRSAVINGQAVSVGEQVADAVVIDIKSYVVRLKRGSKEFSIRLLSEDSVKITGASRKAIQDGRVRGQGELREW
jgi:hypothetical protein